MKTKIDEHVPEDFNYDYFDNPHANGYRGYWKHAENNQYICSWQEICDYCLRYKIKTALDIGCAKGYLVQELINTRIEAIGYEVSDYALSFTADIPCYKQNVIDGIRHKVDAIFALGVLLYIPYKDLDGVINSIFSSSDKFFFFSSYYKGQPQGTPDSLRVITESRSWWKKKIVSSGFTFMSQEKYFDVYQK